jgi:hypothetical protein
MNISRTDRNSEDLKAYGVVRNIGWTAFADPRVTTREAATVKEHNHIARELTMPNQTADDYSERPAALRVKMNNSHWAWLHR